LKAARDKTQHALPGVLARFKQLRGAGATLFVELPFAPDDAAYGDPTEHASDYDFLTLEVSAWDDTTITGTLLDDSDVLPLKKGQSVTRKRSEVTDYVLKLADGGIESGSKPD
jgi:hypothetical protein